MRDDVAGQTTENREPMNSFRVLTFDCYGTLINWEAGIFSALRPILAVHGRAMDDSTILELYGEFEAEAEAGRYQPYRDVLAHVVHAFGQRLGFTPSMEEEKSLAKSLKNWKPWPDTVAALRQLKKKFRLAILSNIDDDLFVPTGHYLQVKFDKVITAQQAQCYKPCRKLFELALERVGVRPEEVLHVGQSIYHDVEPARSLGMGTVWVNRASARPGVGAVKAGAGKPDWEVPDLASLVRLIGA
jgi:2-haloacid dehalogenase